MPILNVNGKKHEAEDVRQENHSALIRIDGKEVKVELLRELSRDPLVLLVRTGSRVSQVSAVQKGDPYHYDIQLNGKPLTVTLEHGEEQGQGSGTGAPEGPVTVNAPMAGRITSLKTAIGGKATEGQTLLVLEAMKMENEIAAPKTGIVKEVYVQPGALVKAGDKLCLLE